MVYQESNHQKNFKQIILAWLRLTNKTTIKVYHGYGHEKQMTIYGHVLKLSPLPRKRYRQSILINALSLLRLFMVKPYKKVRLMMEWEGKTYYTETDDDGFFRFEWQDQPPLPQGWHDIVVRMINNNEESLAEGKGAIYIPHPTQYGFISDIDDTFLISHSSNLRKRLFVLFTHNARSRKPFDGSVKHYQLLARGNTTPDALNPFFYVSSSEWNLYDYIHEFTRVNKLPDGVFLLNILKRFNQIFKTGQNNHHTKFTRIVRILEAYPKQNFVLLGDSSQQDPYIYLSIVKHFPKQVRAVYIRDVHASNKQKVSSVLNEIESTGIDCCFFQHSSEAIDHSRKIGLITEEIIAG